MAAESFINAVSGLDCTLDQLVDEVYDGYDFYDADTGTFFSSYLDLGDGNDPALIVHTVPFMAFFPEPDSPTADLGPWEIASAYEGYAIPDDPYAIRYALSEHVGHVLRCPGGPEGMDGFKDAVEKVVAMGTEELEGDKSEDSRSVAVGRDPSDKEYVATAATKHVLIARHGDDALVRRGDEFIVARGYDAEKGVWSHGSYCGSDLVGAVCGLYGIEMRDGHERDGYIRGADRALVQDLDPDLTEDEADRIARMANDRLMHTGAGKEALDSALAPWVEEEIFTYLDARDDVIGAIDEGLEHDVIEAAREAASIANDVSANAIDGHVKEDQMR